MTLKLQRIVLFVADLEKEAAFYREKLGLPVSEEREGWIEFDAGACRIALHRGKRKARLDFNSDRAPGRHPAGTAGPGCAPERRQTASGSRSFLQQRQGSGGKSLSDQRLTNACQRAAVTRSLSLLRAASLIFRRALFEDSRPRYTRYDVPAGRRYRLELRHVLPGIRPGVGDKKLRAFATFV